MSRSRCCPDLGPVDVALLDGDHNWYTVLSELRLLMRAARESKRSAPLVFCHDVAWPYGRRDLYYEPARIPAEYRHPWKRAGVAPGRSGLVPGDGMNRQLANAEREGGPRNGVLTAIEDFVEESDEELELTILPVLHGLAVLAPSSRLAASPRLADLLRHWRSAAGWRKLALLAEQERQRQLAASNSHGTLRPPGSRRSGAAPPGREPATTLAPELLANIERGITASRYRGREFLKSPFDVVLYLQLIDRLRPRTVIEVGTKEGGSALWFADTLSAYGIAAQVITIDTTPPPSLDNERVRVMKGDARQLEEVLSADLLDSVARPLVVVDDSAHTFETSSAILKFFDPHLRSGDYIVIEDGIVAHLPGSNYERYADGPNRAVAAFMQSRADAYAVDETLCDHFGYNATWSPNAWLQKL